MGRKVENPFKEQGLPSWIRYLVTGLTGFLVAYWIFVGASNVETEEEILSNLRADMQAQKLSEQLLVNARIGARDDDVDDDNANNNSVETDDAPTFPDLDQDQYLDWVRSYYQDLSFESHPPPHKLTPELLEESLTLGCDYMAANQKEEGNFNYQYDFVKQKQDPGDSPVRQAGALWGIALCFQSTPTNSVYKKAVEKGIKFFQKHMADGPTPGSSMIAYPGFEESQSGVNALYGLALIDYTRTIRNHKLEGMDLDLQLGETIRFLKFMQHENGHFAEEYDLEDEEKSINSSPYYDGETLLCLVKAAKYMDGYQHSLIPIIEEAAPILAKAYTLDAWKEEHDSTETKGFYQWSSMIFAEYYFAEWKNYDLFGDLCIILAHWIVHTHTILERQLNTGYAFEGILSAQAIARDRNFREALGDLEYVIDEGLYKLTGWQVGGPLAHTNKFLKKHPTTKKIAVGGIMNAKNKAPLRIDTTQHQMHALMMAKELLFSDGDSEAMFS